MECTCVRYTDLPNTSRLLVDFVYHPDRVAHFYPYLPYSPESYAAAATAIQFPPEKRSALVAALRKLNGDSPSLDLLARDGTAAVVTGQQVGLFSGPAYTIYKALTAAKLARRLTESGIPAVPIFWLATEDHDFAEVNHCWVFNGERQPVKLEVNGSLSADQPVGRISLPQPPVAELRRTLESFPFGEEVAHLVAEAYQPGRTLGESFSALLRSLLPQELLHVDPLAPEIRALAAPTLRKALEMAPDLADRILERNGELQAAGYHAQVHVEPHTSLFFLLENGRRLHLRRNGSDYQLNGRVFRTAELQDRAEQLSPNALLRPVIQDCILPTVAYVGGPAELAYLAQSEVIYRSILGRMPVPVHRAGFTLVDNRARKLMQRYGLSLPDVLHPLETLRERMARHLVPRQVTEILERARLETADSLGRMHAALASFDPTLASALTTSRRKMEYQLAKIDRKIAREVLSRDTRATENAAFLHSLLFPNKHLQERLYSILPFLAEHGPGLVDRLYENVHLDCPDHQLLTSS